MKAIFNLKTSLTPQLQRNPTTHQIYLAGVTVVGAGSAGFCSASLTMMVGAATDGSRAGLRCLKSLFSQYQRTQFLTQSMSWGTNVNHMKRCRTISSNVCFVGHEDDIVEIIQEVDDIVDAILGSVLRVCVALN
jgi:hypothetical protein